MWSPKRMTLLWFSGVCEGSLVLIAFFGHLFSLGLIKSLQCQGWGWFSNLRGFSWLWVLWLSNQLFERGMLLSKWATN